MTLGKSGVIGGFCAPRFCFPMEIQPDVRAFAPTGLTGEARLHVGQPEIIRPLVAADRDPVTIVIIAAIDQQSANAHFAQLAAWIRVNYLTRLSALRDHNNSLLHNAGAYPILRLVCVPSVTRKTRRNGG
jgi:hypothetical protein